MIQHKKVDELIVHYLIKVAEDLRDSPHCKPLITHYMTKVGIPMKNIIIDKIDLNGDSTATILDARLALMNLQRELYVTESAGDLGSNITKLIYLMTTLY